MVVLMLLALFSVVGLTFVFYANDAATASRIHREANAPGRMDMDPELLFAYFMNQFVYDVWDDELGTQSSLRGHSLGRNLFGFNYTVDAAGRFVPAANDAPFSGSGRWHLSSPFAGVDDFHLIHYRHFPGDGFVRDPERPGTRASLQKSPNRYLGGFNPPYTSPDLNHLFLGVLKGGASMHGNFPEGTVLLQSFHRPWLFGPLTDLKNSNWRNAAGKYLLLRPRPIDHGPGFPYAEDEGGDVQNVIGGPGYYDALFTKRRHTNDSVWLDLGAPILIGPDGRKYKALFAPFVIDLDGRLNLNVAGNLRGILPKSKQIVHASHMGWGPWEMNPARVLNATPSEWQNLLKGSQDPKYGRVLSGRFGFATAPAGMVAGGPARFFAPVDYDGVNELLGGLRTGPLRLPGTGLAPPWQCFPGPTPGYGNKSALERTNHSKLFNPFNPQAPAHRLALANLEGLLRYGDTGAPALPSDLLRLCPQNFADPSDVGCSTRRRHQVTPLSFDVNRPGISPYLAWPLPEPIPGGGSASLATYAGLEFPDPSRTSPVGPGSEFGADWRASAAATSLRRVNLNRPLPDYPPLDPFSGRITDLNGFVRAQAARQQLAGDVFRVLYTATGAGSPLDVWPPALIKLGIAPDATRWHQLRRLAQLAVNIVDFIDNDDYVTPFRWYPVAPPDPYRSTGHPGGDWVFGTELPRVALNEAYVEYDNHPNDPTLPKVASILKANLWVELVNTFREDGFSLQAPWRTGSAMLQAPLSAGAYPIYRLIVAELATDLRNAENVRGEIRPGTGDVALAEVNSFGPGAMILPADAKRFGGYSGPPGGNQGFAVLGPQLLPGEDDPFRGSVPPTLRSPQLTYTVPATGVPPKPSLLLQRLACPFLPPNPHPVSGPDPSLPYNPYLTVDMMHQVEPSLVAKFGAPGLPPPTLPALRSSSGRRQPYGGNATQTVRQRPLPRLAGMPQHTFFRHNATLGTPGPNWPNPPANYPAFDWLVHLDRPLVSPIELIHVSAWRPHELTQEFSNPAGVFGQEYKDVSGRPKGFNHRAPWLDQDLTQPGTTHRLYRALEFFTTEPNHVEPFLGAIGVNQVIDAGPNKVVALRPATRVVTGAGGSWTIRAGDMLRVRGTRQVGGTPVLFTEDVHVRAVGAASFTADFVNTYDDPKTITITPLLERIPGKINLNTVWDLEVFDALCDLFAPPGTVSPLVRDMFRELVELRTPGTFDAKLPVEAPGPSDRPFLSLATGLRVNQPSAPLILPNSSLDDTILRKGKANPDLPLFAVRNTEHPYQRYELLNKIFNQVTTRSNVFALWLTVGFFEVTDGPVTRTNSAVSGTGSQSVTVSALSGSINGVPWDIHDGSSVVVGRGANEETVYVTAVDAANRTFTASFTKAHAAATVISHKNCLGAEVGRSVGRHIRHRMFAIVDRSVLTRNPGPQPRFDPRVPSPGSASGSVVRYYSIID